MQLLLLNLIGRHVTKWIVPVMCSAVFAIILAAVCVLKKGKMRGDGRYKRKALDKLLPFNTLTTWGRLCPHEM